MVKVLDIEVGTAGYGLMGLTWRETPPPKEQSFKAMKAALNNGINFWNGGELYGTPEANSLHLLNEYFTKYPEDADKVVLSIKGGFNAKTFTPDGSEEGIARSIETCVKLLDGKKKLDLFEAARVDPKVPIETTLKAIQKYVDAGKVGGISLSEVSAETIRRAAKIVKVSAVEVEFSMFATDILQNGIAQACAELNIPIVAYSPIGRGFLSGEYKKPEDVPKGDIKSHLPMFHGDAFYNNLKLVKETEAIAKKKGVTAAQVAIAWVKAHSGRDGLGPIIPIPGASSESRVNENYADVTLTNEEVNEIDELLKTFTPLGVRRGTPGEHLMNG